MKMPPPTVENQASSLLSTDENLQVFKLLGNRCQTMATTVVQLFTTSAPSHLQWIKKDTGVLCFVKDNNKKNYFFRLFSLKHNHLVWEHEMYNNMDYVDSDTTPFFHIFEGDDYMVAFNFANLPEANNFKAVVDSKISAKRRKEEKRARAVSQSQTINPLLPQKNLDFAAKQEFRKQKRQRNITKADIGIPTGFVHVSHVGWNPDTGFDVDIGDEQLKGLFQKAGVSEKQLKDKETRAFIYDFISKNRHMGGTELNPPPVVPPRGPPRPTSATPRPAPPPPPSHTAQLQRKPKPPSPPKPRIVGPSAPPPPPPPPPSVPVAPPPPPPMTMSNGAAPVPDANAALMQSIREGTTLKSVEEHKQPVVEDARSDLLSEIRKGIQLKPVDEREVRPMQNPSPTSNDGGNDLARALKMALLERSKVIHSEDDDDDTSSTSNDDEWDD